jgi:GNAT superfamily N-acetyltransferase
MVKEAPETRNRIIDILAMSFAANKSVQAICGNNLQRIRGLMAYGYDNCTAFGRVYLNEDLSACALVLFPDRKRTSLKTILWDLKLVFKVIGLKKLFKVLKRESVIKSHHPRAPFSYLWFIGVDPSMQGRGKGSTLLDSIIEDAAVANRPVYLETSTIENIAFYKRHGLEVFGELKFGYTLFMLRKCSS